MSTADRMKMKAILRSSAQREHMYDTKIFKSIPPHLNHPPTIFDLYASLHFTTFDCCYCWCFGFHLIRSCRMAWLSSISSSTNVCTLRNHSHFILLQSLFYKDEDSWNFVESHRESWSEWKKNSKLQFLISIVLPFLKNILFRMMMLWQFILKLTKGIKEYENLSHFPTRCNLDNSLNRVTRWETQETCELLIQNYTFTLQMKLRMIVEL